MNETLLWIEAFKALFCGSMLKFTADYNATRLWYVYVSELRLCQPLRTLMSQVRSGCIAYIYIYYWWPLWPRVLKHYDQITHSLVVWSFWSSTLANTANTKPLTGWLARLWRPCSANSTNQWLAFVMTRWMHKYHKKCKKEGHVWKSFQWYR